MQKSERLRRQVEQLRAALQMTLDQLAMIETSTGECICPVCKQRARTVSAIAHTHRCPYSVLSQHWRDK